MAVKYNQTFINNEFFTPSGGEKYLLINPATEELLTEVVLGGEKEIDQAVCAARDAFEGKAWKKLGGTGRGQLLWKLAELIERDAREIAELETANQGKPIFESHLIDVPFAAQVFRYFAGWADKIEGETIPVHNGFLNFTQKEPVGVVGMIVPWNFPLILTAWKLGPALAAGCTAVIKPAEWTPLSALKLAALAVEAGFPPGVINVVPGLGTVAGNALTKHPGIDKVSFTGSTVTGKTVMKNCAEGVKRLSLELGGKSPQIIFADADLEKAATGVCGGIYYNKGEVCAAGSRLYVESSIYDQFLELVKGKMARYQPGDPMHEKTRLGPQAHKSHQEKVMTAIKTGLSEGATLVSGGEASQINGKGYYVQPTLFSRVKNSHTLAREEVFGPVLAAIPFEDEADVITQANDSLYGLAAGIWSKDGAKALRTASKIKAGTVWVNTYNLYHPGSPFGGFKGSGFGRELGRESIDLFTETRSVWVSLG